LVSIENLGIEGSQKRQDGKFRQNINKKSPKSFQRLLISRVLLCGTHPYLRHLEKNKI
jgi:hypothetical protein